MEEDELHFLEKSLTNTNNKGIKDLTYYKINDTKVNILKELNLSKTETNKLLKKLQDYRYIDELPELIEGRYIRWINLDDTSNLKLTTGGILCEIKVNDFITLVLKNNMNRFFQINLDENLIFQRLSDQEKIILYAIDIVNE